MAISKSLVYQALQKIKPGQVTTYGRLAKAVGSKSPRWIGQVLHQNPNPGTIPCHRVVNAKGELSKSFAFGGLGGQAKKLQNEGIVIKNGKIKLNRYLFKEQE